MSRRAVKTWVPIPAILLAICGLILSVSIVLADTTITSANTSSNYTQENNLVWTGFDTGYFFYVDSVMTDGALHYLKTTDGGATWGAAVQIDDSTPPGGYSLNSFDVWFDKWTPGETGVNVHVAWRYFKTASPQGVLAYRRLNTTTDVMGSEITITSQNSDNTAGIDDWDTRRTSIVKAKGGALFIKTNFTSFGFVRSLDDGDTWASRINLAGIPPMFLAPHSTSGNLYLIGNNAGTFEIHTYDNGANAWSGPWLASSVGSDFTEKRWGIALDQAAGTVWATVATTAGELRVYQINSELDIVTRTAVTSGSATLSDVDIMFDTINNELYSVYSRTGAGVFYKVSTDNGVTWGAETSVFGTFGYPRIQPVILTGLPRFMPVYFISPNWRSNVNFLVIATETVRENIDKWTQDFSQIFGMLNGTTADPDNPADPDDSGGNLLMGVFIMLSLAVGLIYLKVHTMITLSLLGLTGAALITISFFTPAVMVISLALVGYAVMITLLATMGGNPALAMVVMIGFLATTGFLVAQVNNSIPQTIEAPTSVDEPKETNSGGLTGFINTVLEPFKWVFRAIGKLISLLLFRVEGLPLYYNTFMFLPLYSYLFIQIVRLVRGGG